MPTTKPRFWGSLTRQTMEFCVIAPLPAGKAAVGFDTSSALCGVKAMLPGFSIKAVNSLIFAYTTCSQLTCCANLRMIFKSRNIVSLSGSSALQCAQLLRTLIILRTHSRWLVGKYATVRISYQDLSAMRSRAARSKSDSLEKFLFSATSRCE